MSKSRNAGCLAGAIIAAGALVAGQMALRKLKNAPLATKRVELLDVSVDPLTMPEALARIEAFIASGEPHHVFTADASGIMRVQDEPELKTIVQQADMITADGAGVLLASSMRGERLPSRVSGCDLVEEISALAAEKGYRIYLFGAAEGIAQAAADALLSRHPGLNVAGVRNGFFTAEEEPLIVQQIAEAKPDVLFVALGIPKQEHFIRTHFAALGVPVMIGVGGSFDVISGQLQRAPVWMQRTGLEWLFRLAQQPARLPRMAALPKFVLAAWREHKK